ncbi:hypothetical protein Efla_000852 [Eimeria flavescens]
MEPTSACDKPPSSQHTTEEREQTHPQTEQSVGGNASQAPGDRLRTPGRFRGAAGRRWHWGRGFSSSIAFTKARPKQFAGRNMVYRAVQREQAEDHAEGDVCEQEPQNDRVDAKRDDAHCGEARRPRTHWRAVTTGVVAQQQRPLEQRQQSSHRQPDGEQHQPQSSQRRQQRFQQKRSDSALQEQRDQQSYHARRQQQPVQLQHRQHDLQEGSQQKSRQPQPRNEQQHQRQQRNPQAMPSRPVTCRPQISLGIPTVVVELQRLSRLYSDSFRLLSCHPFLVPLLQKHTWIQKGGEILRAQMASLRAEGPREAAAAEGIDPAHELGSHGPIATNREDEGGQQDARGEELCKFELVFKPTDPDFDGLSLPNGLTLQISMGKNYPGADSILKIATAKPFERSAAVEQPSSTPPCANPEGVASEEASCPEATGAADAAAHQGRLADEIDQGCASRGPQTLPAGGGSLLARASAGVAQNVASLRVCNQEINNFRRGAIEVLFAKSIQKLRNAQQKGDFIRLALRVLDRFLREIFEVTSMAHLTAPSESQAWTPSEQRKLEEAVVLFRRVADPVLRWRNISNHVGSRSTKECAVRFKVCRENVLRQRQEAEKREGTESNSLVASQGSDGEDAKAEEYQEQEGRPTPALEGKSTLLRGLSVSLLEPVTEGIASLHLSCVRLQVACGRCKHAIDMRISLPKDGTTLEAAGRFCLPGVAGCSVDCEKCRLHLTVRVQPVIGLGGGPQMRVAAVEPCECMLKDLLPCDFIFTCDCCSASMKGREFLSGAPRTNICRHCHSKLTFGFQGAAFGNTLVSGQGTARCSDVARSSAEYKQRKHDLRIVVGSPLEGFGTCKHYKKSFRWLRFPCCGKAYPCDICHDKTEDHDHEWAARMICGFCSTEQPFANGKPCSCGKALTKDGGSAHWEASDNLYNTCN